MAQMDRRIRIIQIIRPIHNRIIYHSIVQITASNRIVHLVSAGVYRWCLANRRRPYGSNDNRLVDNR